MCVIKKVMFGCYIMLFARDDHAKNIKKTCSCKVKTGTAGITANKGSTSFRFNYDDTSLMFLNCHLTSGQKQWKERMDELKFCYEETNYNFNQAIGEKHDQEFLFGDMNWRVDLPYEQAVKEAV